MRDGRAHARETRAAALLAVLGFTALVACGRAAPAEVSAGSALPPRSAAPSAPDVSSFQGSVAAVDPAAGEVTIRVQIVWTPAIKAEPHDRLVTVDDTTRWVPVRSDLHVGQEVQIQAAPAAGGRWQALQIQLLDVE